MPDKTRLEHEIERHEMYRTSFGVGLLIVLLITMLSVSGIYIYKLRQEIIRKDHEIIRIKENFQKEKTELLRKIKQFSDASNQQGKEHKTEETLSD